MSKIQKQDHARILRGALPPEVMKRLAERAAADRRALEQAAADAAIAVEELTKAQAVAYKATLQDRMKKEQRERFQ